MYAVIDIETTGGNHRWGKITEIAIFIHDGEQVTAEFSTLINPEISISPFITQLTGISNEMVQEAPTFEEVAPAIAQITEGQIFVAHNSQFDYHFIRAEFQRLGKEFERPTLCTVRTSRRLIPDQPSYSLGKLCDQLGIELENRHRAGGDAAATVKLLELLFSLDKENQLQSHICWQQPSSEYNKYLQNTKIEDLPQSPGLVYFRGKDDALLYIDSARNMRKRVIAHLKNKGGRSTFNIREKIKEVDFEETGTYLIAQLRAQEEVAKNKPLLNPPSRPFSPPKRWFIVPELQLDGYVHLKLERMVDSGRAISFRSKKEALEGLEELIAGHQLCAAFTPAGGAIRSCQNGHKVSCNGACEAQESPQGYNSRIDVALQSLEEKESQLIVEKGRNPLEKALIKIERSQFVSWGYLSLEEYTQNVDRLLECATTVCRSPGASEIAQKYILKNNVQKIISY